MGAVALLENEQGRDWLVHQDNIVNRLAPEHGRERLTKKLLARTVKAIEMLQVNAASVYQRPWK